MRGKHHIQSGFTLIELLIVVAIIAILAAIAVPNFLEAQVRSKVARCKSDMRTIGVALESYAIDTNGKYPFLPGNRSRSGATAQITRGPVNAAYGLSTPIAYLTTVEMLDPFCKTKTYDQFGYTNLDNPAGGTLQAVFTYVNTRGLFEYELRKPFPGDRPMWWVVSNGPDFVPGPDARDPKWTVTTYGYSSKYPQDPEGKHEWTAYNYDPTNGTISGGDIMKHQ